MKSLLFICLIYTLSFCLPPVAKFSVNGTAINDNRIYRWFQAKAGETICFDASLSTDPENNTLTYLWDFGDGSPTDTHQTICRTFANAGGYSVTLKVDDGTAGNPDSTLLTGMTPDDYTLPSGWTLVKAQNFEYTNKPSNESGYGDTTRVKKHSGNKSYRSQVWKDDVQTGWRLPQGNITTGEIYLSWYEYMDSSGRQNDEMWLLNIHKFFPDNKFEYQRYQWINKLDIDERMFNIYDGRLVIFCEGTQTGTTGSVAYYDSSSWLTCGFGEWRQWEVHWKTNTPGVSDGIYSIYLNGNKVAALTNTAFSGTIADMTGPAVTLGGETYTKVVWGQEDQVSCATSVANLVNEINREKNFANPCQCPGQCPPLGYTPIFYRYIDDIIILQR